MKLKISQENIDQRLDVFLSQQDKNISRSQWQKRIKAGQVLVNGAERTPHYKLRANDKIGVRDQGLGLRDRKLVKYSVKIVFEHKHYLIINKPSGMVVHPDNVNKNNTLVDWLIKEYPEIKDVGEDKSRPGIIHRLDKDVSGLIVVARNQQMFEHLKKQFKDRKVKKEYLALVHNQMKQDEGEIKLALKRSKKRGIFVAITDTFKGLFEGRSALTKYQVIQRFKNFTLLKIKLLTGRTHQIRAHLRSIGHPIMGDKLYTTRDIRKKNKVVELGRLWLHASKLGFKDLAGEWQEFESEIPKGLEEFLNRN